MKKILFSFVFILLISFSNTAYADPTDINLTIRDGANIIFSGLVPFPAPGTINLTDSTGTSQTVNAQSVLSVIDNADQNNATWNISELTYYSSFSSLYLKSINYSGGTKSDNWQYTVNNLTPSVGMDQNILTGGETVYLYFGNPYQVVLSSNSITTNDPLTVTAQSYDYANNTWATRIGVTVGLTQPDPNNPYSPIEVQTNAVDANGQANFNSIIAGSYNVGIKEDFYYPTETLTVMTPPSPQIQSHGGRPVLIIPPKKIFDIQKAYDFLIAQQKENGSFGQDLYTDWAGIALVASPDYLDQKTKLKNYLLQEKFSAQTLTDYERRSIALMALGINPYDISGENYIKKITDSFDGKQYGDIDQNNDDIFALIVLQNAGYSILDKEISESINFILSKQKENGSWDESVDMTGAGIQTLANFKENTRVALALSRAKEYLKQNQQTDGGWKNISSTSWAMQGISALGEKFEDWKNNNTPVDYLANNQENDGGIKNENLNNKIWETSYAVSSLSGKTWNQIMTKFEKPKVKVIIPVQIVQKEINKIKPAKVSKVKKIKTITNITTQNLASLINANLNIQTKTIETPKKQSKLKKFLKRIFRF